MSMYLIKWALTGETWQRLLDNPEDRREVMQAFFEAAGGKLHGLWYAFGDHDGYTLGELPDDVTAATLSVKAAASGAYRSLSTTKLISTDEALEAFRRAGGVQYRPPGAPA